MCYVINSGINGRFSLDLSKLSNSNRPKNCESFLQKKNQNKNIAIGNFDYLADFSV